MIKIKDYIKLILLNKNMNTDLSKVEVFILNRYAASELAGSILLGKMARKISSAKSSLLVSLTRHAMEEARHSYVWYGLIKKLKVPTISIHDDGGEAYFSHINEANNITEFLAFTHVFENRVPFHFGIHAQWSKNQMVKDVLNKLILEEKPHLTWIREYLKEEISKGNIKVKEDLERFAKLEKELYYRDLTKLESLGEEGKSFVRMVKNHINKFENELKWWQK